MIKRRDEKKNEIRRKCGRASKMATAFIKMNPLSDTFHNDIRGILQEARSNAYSSIISTMVEAYWRIGERIAEEEQKGKQRAEYGKKLLQNLATTLSAEFGKGFDERELRRLRQFYLSFPNRDTVCPELTWSHYRRLIRISNEEARIYYMMEAAKNHWSVRVLDRNINTLYYERLLSSQSSLPQIETQPQRQEIQQRHFIKDPYVLEFLELPANQTSTEKTLENALLDNLQRFLLELGKGFAFVARQRLIRTETSDFFLDLVFYNYFLKCFVIIDLKTRKMTHQDIGQKYSVLNENKQLFASKYITYLPSEKELITEIEREKQIIEQENIA